MFPPSDIRAAAAITLAGAQIAVALLNAAAMVPN